MEKGDMPKGVVTYGSQVTVKDLSDGMEEIYDQIMKDDLGVWSDFHHGSEKSGSIIRTV